MVLLSADNNYLSILVNESKSLFCSTFGWSSVSTIWTRSKIWLVETADQPLEQALILVMLVETTPTNPIMRFPLCINQVVQLASFVNVLVSPIIFQFMNYQEYLSRSKKIILGKWLSSWKVVNVVEVFTESSLCFYNAEFKYIYKSQMIFFTIQLCCIILYLGWTCWYSKESRGQYSWWNRLDKTGMSLWDCGLIKLSYF